MRNRKFKSWGVLFFFILGRGERSLRKKVTRTSSCRKGIYLATTRPIEFGKASAFSPTGIPCCWRFVSIWEYSTWAPKKKKTVGCGKNQSGGVKSSKEDQAPEYFQEDKVRAAGVCDFQDIKNYFGKWRILDDSEIYLIPSPCFLSALR